MKAKVVETGEIVDVVSITDRQYGCLISYWDGKKGKEYSRFELDFNVGAQMKGVQMNEEIVKTIDWEQRRYEIAKNVLANIPVDFPKEIEDQIIVIAIRRADMLIKELKKTSK